MSRVCNRLTWGWVICVWLTAWLGAAVAAQAAPADASGVDRMAVTRTDAIRAVLLDATSPWVLVVSHRGHHREHPENSLEAIDAAIAAGAHIIELDVGQTADGTLVLMHDATIDRTTTGTGRLDRMTDADLARVWLTNKSRPSGAKVPTLLEALARVRGRAMVNLDPKGIDVIAAAQAAEAAGLLDHCVFKQWWHRMTPEAIAWFAQRADVVFMPICESPQQIDEALRHRRWPVIEVIAREADGPLWGRDFTDGLRRRGVMPWVNVLWSGQISAGLGDYHAAFNPPPIFDAVLASGWGVVQTDLVEAFVDAVQRHGLYPQTTAPPPPAAAPAPRHEPVDWPARIRDALGGRDPGALFVAAHRGHHLAQPENSVSAVEAAIRLGTAAVALDVRRTRSGDYVLLRDPDVRRTTFQRGLAAEMSNWEITGIQLRHGVYPSRDRVPLLTDVTRATRGRVMVALNVPDAHVEDLINQLSSDPQASRDVVVFFDWSATAPPTRQAFAQVVQPAPAPRVRSAAEAEEARQLRPWPVLWLDGSEALTGLDPAQVRAWRESGTLTWVSIRGDGIAGAGDDALVRGGAHPTDIVTTLRNAGVAFVETDLPERFIFPTPAIQE